MRGHLNGSLKKDKGLLVCRRNENYFRSNKTLPPHQSWTWKVYKVYHNRGEGRWRVGVCIEADCTLFYA